MTDDQPENTTEKLQRLKRQVGEAALAELRRRLAAEGLTVEFVASADPIVKDGWWIIERAGTSFVLSGKRGPHKTEIAALTAATKITEGRSSK